MRDNPLVEFAAILLIGTWLMLGSLSTWNAVAHLNRCYAQNSAGSYIIIGGISFILWPALAITGGLGVKDCKPEAKP